jgi:hypothetical protein
VTVLYLYTPTRRLRVPVLQDGIVIHAVTLPVGIDVSPAHFESTGQFEDAA